MMIKNQRAFAVGILFIVVASTFVVLSLDLQQGTAARMGPGYFPWILGIVLCAVGLAIVAGAVAPGAAAERLSRWDWKGLGWIAGSVVLFAVLLQPLGLIVSLFVLVVASSSASPDFTLRGSLAAAVVLIVICVAAFDYGMDLRIPLWPAIWE